MRTASLPNYLFDVFSSFKKKVYICTIIQSIKKYESMKKYLIFSLLSIVFLLSGCSKEEDFHINGIDFKKADITGAQMLALGQPSTDAKEANVLSMLYKVNEQGILEEVEYTIEVRAENDSVSHEVNARVRLSIRELIPFGEKWLWLKECHFVCPTIDSIENPDLRREVEDLLRREDWTRNYLVRLTDGALFDWSWGQIPYGGWDFQENTAQYFRGRCEPIGEDLFTVNSELEMYCLKDRGNSIEVSTVTPTSIWAFNVFPLKDGVHIGSELDYGGGHEPYIINTNTLQIIPIQVSSEMYPEGWETYASKMVCIDGQIYIPLESFKNEQWSDTRYRLSFCRVHLSDDHAVADEEVASVEFNSEINSMTDISNTGLAEPLFYGTVFSFITGGQGTPYRIFTFDSERQSLTYKPLPDHYPSNATDYRDGVGYVVDHSADIPTSYWRCDLAQETAEMVPIVWDGDLQNYLSQMVLSSLVLEYEMGSNSILGYCMLLDGRKVSFHGDAEGPDRGRMHILLEGEQTAGVVVTTMVRLN